MKMSLSVLCLCLSSLCVSACASDGLALQAVTRNEKVWQEDRRPDLDPELVKAREAEFAAQKRYFGGK